MRLNVGEKVELILGGEKVEPDWRIEEIHCPICGKLLAKIAKDRKVEFGDQVVYTSECEHFIAVKVSGFNERVEFVEVDE